MPADGTIILIKYHGAKRFVDRLVSKAIMFFTKSPFIHVMLYFDGKTYDSYAWLNPNTKKMNQGFRVRDGFKKGDIYLEPIKKLTDEEKEKMRAYLEQEIKEKEPYNFIKLVALAFIYPTKHFWRWIGWVPFSNEFFGRVCSTRVDEAWKSVRDIFPKELEGYTVPGDFMKLIEFGTFRQIYI